VHIDQLIRADKVSIEQIQFSFGSSSSVSMETELVFMLARRMHRPFWNEGMVRLAVAVRPIGHDWETFWKSCTRPEHRVFLRRVSSAGS